MIPAVVEEDKAHSDVMLRSHGLRVTTCNVQNTSSLNGLYGFCFCVTEDQEAFDVHEEHLWACVVGHVVQEYTNRSDPHSRYIAKLLVHQR